MVEREILTSVINEKMDEEISRQTADKLKAEALAIKL